MTTRRRFLAISAAFALSPAAASAPVRWQGTALGADATITLHGPEAEAWRAVEAVREVIETVESLFSLHRPRSAISELNRSGRLAPVPPDFLKLLKLADRLHRATGGRFDPTVQPLWVALATGRTEPENRPNIGWHRVRVDGSEIALGSGQALTLNGVAQGYATDLVADLLADRGFEEALVHLGEHRALGGPWRLALEDVVHGPIGIRTLTDRAIATSSPAALPLGDAWSHILDPTGERRPIWSTVSVEASRAGIADGLSTAFCLMSEDEIRAIRRSFPEMRRVTLVDATGNVRTQV